MTTEELRQVIGTNSVNLKFHDYQVKAGAGCYLAFVTCIDVQSHGNGKNKKYYWGCVSGHDPSADEIKEIIRVGGKWDGKNEEGKILL